MSYTDLNCPQANPDTIIGEWGAHYRQPPVLYLFQNLLTCIDHKRQSEYKKTLLDASIYVVVLLYFFGSAWDESWKAQEADRSSGIGRPIALRLWSSTSQIVP
jgi:hypothetical protein